MKFKNIITVAIVVVVANSANAQYSGDALRFSQFENSVDARFGAMGGTHVSVGGTMSSLYGNPAGLGMFTKSEFSLTPTVNFTEKKVTAFGANSNLSNSNLNLNNLGVVFHARTHKVGNAKQGLLSMNFGIGYQQRANFNNQFNFTGTTTANGLGDLFTQKSNLDIDDDSFPASPQRLLSRVNRAANSANLTSYDDTFSDPYVAITSDDSDQYYDISRKGGSNNIDFSLGFNISNKLFLGAGLSLANFNYTSTERVNEVGVYQTPGSASTNDYDVDYIKYFDTDGSGINLKFGAIFKPVSELQVGVSFESPTWYSVNDNYSESFLDRRTRVSGDDSFPYDYSLRTPLRLSGGISYFVGKRGFISADVGVVDYASIQFSSDNSRTDMDTRREINELYQSAINYSLGGEFKLNQNFLLRAGFRSNGNPYKNLDDKDYTINSVSGGVGYRFGDYYFDAALINSNSNLSYSNYSLNNGNEPRAIIDTRSNQIALTFGVRF